MVIAENGRDALRQLRMVRHRDLRAVLERLELVFIVFTSFLNFCIHYNPYYGICQQFFQKKIGLAPYFFYLIFRISLPSLPDLNTRRTLTMLAFRKNPIAMLWASLPVRVMMESVCPSVLMQMQVLAIVRVIVIPSLIHFLGLVKIEMVNLGHVQQLVLLYALSKHSVQLVHQLCAIILACLNKQEVRTGFLPLRALVVDNRLFGGVADSVDVRHLFCPPLFYCNHYSILGAICQGVFSKITYLFSGQRL